MKFDRISHNIEIMGGEACIKGARVTVSMIIGQLGSGKSKEKLLGEFPYLSTEDIMQALQYVAWLADAREMEIVAA